MSIINDILDFSKVESGRLELESISFDLYQVVKSIIELFQADCEAKGIDCCFYYAENLPKYFVGDPVRVRQVILNLVNNAVKFTEKGNITITVEGQEKDSDETKNKLIIVVKDTGVGISQDAINTLFQSFVQADNSTTRRYGGSGLGLAISKQLVELMGGSIEVASNIDEGTTFQICLPLDVAQKGDQYIQNETVTHGHNTQLEGKVLLVEDVYTNQLVVKSLLEPYNLDVVTEDDGKKAIGRLQRESFDLVLMDCQMPIMDGFEATQYIRNNLSKNIPIIALTADAYRENTQRCYEAGMNDFLTKPFTEDMLVNVIAKWLPKENSLSQ